MVAACITVLDVINVILWFVFNIGIIPGHKLRVFRHTLYTVMWSIYWALFVEIVYLNAFHPSYINYYIIQRKSKMVNYMFIVIKI